MKGNDSNNRNGAGPLPTHNFHRINLPNVFRRRFAKNDRIKFVNVSQSFCAAKYYILLLLFTSIIVRLDVETRAWYTLQHNMSILAYNCVCFRCRYVYRFQTINNCSCLAHDLWVSYFLGLGSRSLIEWRVQVSIILIKLIQ